MKFQLHRDRKKEFRWRLVARNGRIIAESGEGYKRKAGALKSLRLVQAYCALLTFTGDLN